MPLYAETIWLSCRQAGLPGAETRPERNSICGDEPCYKSPVTIRPQQRNKSMKNEIWAQWAHLCYDKSCRRVKCMSGSQEVATVKTMPARTFRWIKTLHLREVKKKKNAKISESVCLLTTSLFHWRSLAVDMQQFPSLAVESI